MKTNRKFTFELFSKYRTLIMGLATISVLIFHFTDDRRMYSFGFNGVTKAYNLLVSSGGVDIFLLLSGLGLYYSFSRNNNYKNFLVKRVKRTVIPYLMVAVPSIVVATVMEYGSFKAVKFLKELFFGEFILNGDCWFWYILFINICYLIFPWIYNLINSKKTNIEAEETLLNLFAVVTVTALLCFYFANEFFGNINIMLLRLPVFCFGVYLGKLSFNKEPITNKWIAFLVITLILVPLRFENRIMLTRYIIGLVNISLVFLFVQLMEFSEQHKLKLTVVKSVLNFFGKYSLEIYLTHVAIRKFFLRLGFPTYRIRYEAAMVLCSVAVSLAVNYLSGKILSKNIKNKPVKE